jgi:hypothetical protein
LKISAFLQLHEKSSHAMNTSRTRAHSLTDSDSDSEPATRYTDGEKRPRLTHDITHLEESRMDGEWNRPSSPTTVTVPELQTSTPTVNGELKSLLDEMITKPKTVNDPVADLSQPLSSSMHNPNAHILADSINSKALTNGFIEFEENYKSSLKMLQDRLPSADPELMKTFLLTTSINNAISSSTLQTEVNLKKFKDEINLMNDIRQSVLKPTLLPEPQIHHILPTVINQFVKPSPAVPTFQMKQQVPTPKAAKTFKDALTTGIPTTTIAKSQIPPTVATPKKFTTGSYPVKERRIIIDTHGPALFYTPHSASSDLTKKTICDTINHSFTSNKLKVSIVAVESRSNNNTINLLIQDGLCARDILADKLCNSLISKAITKFLSIPFNLSLDRNLTSIIIHGINPELVLQSAGIFPEPASATNLEANQWKISDFQSVAPFNALWNEIRQSNPAYEFPKAPRWLTSLKLLHQNFHAPTNARTRASIVIPIDTCQDASEMHSNISNLFSGSRFAPSLYVYGRRCAIGKYITFDESTQCNKCLEYGHHTQRCENIQSNCKHCSQNHATSEHFCTEANCLNKTKSCSHIPPSCFNCKGKHMSGDKDCPYRKEKEHMAFLRRQSEYEQRRARRDAAPTILPSGSPPFRS